MIFREEEPFWREGVVLTYSLSKLGLPGTRTGIVIGPETVCRAVSSMTAVVGLANGTIGQALTLPFFEDGSIIRYCKEVVRPYYETRSQKAVEIIRETFTGISYRIHEPDGALFLWLWFPDLKIHSQELYEKLKNAGVLVVPGHLFFHNLSDEWPHASQCIRINYSMDIEAFPEAMVKIANVLRSPGVSAS